MRATRSRGTLYVVGTPIGNLSDITLRALEVLFRVDLVAAEDTRVTAKLLTRHGITVRTVSLRPQNARRAIPRILERLDRGEEIALVSDAGTPSVSDPGAELVTAAAQAGIPVTPIPGPSALSAAISIAGLPGDGVRFLGFLPRQGRRRRERIAALVTETALTVLYEAPTRVGQTLDQLAQALGPRRAAVLRELTKVHEEVARGTLPELAQRFAQPVKGEVTLVVAGSGISVSEISEEELTGLVARQLAAGQSAKNVAEHLSSSLGLPRKKVYRRALDCLADEPGPGEGG